MKKLGRPKGSKNKVKKPQKPVIKPVIKLKRKVGRPKGSKNRRKSRFQKTYTEYQRKLYKKKEKQDLTWVKISKFLGYCPCGAIIASRNKRTPFTYMCDVCGKKHRTSEIKAERSKEKKLALNKKDYLEPVEINL